MSNNLSELNSYKIINDDNYIVGKYYYLPDGQSVLRFIEKYDNSYLFKIVYKKSIGFCDTSLTIGNGFNKLVPLIGCDISIQI